MGTPPASPKKNKKTRRRGEFLLLLLLALLISCSCIFCSTQLAFNVWSDKLTPANLLAKTQADYHRNPADRFQFAELDPMVGEQAANDILGLQMTPTGNQIDTGGGLLTIANLPATPTPTANITPVPTLPPATKTAPQNTGNNNPTSTGPNATPATTGTASPPSTTTPNPAPQPTSTTLATTLPTVTQQPTATLLPIPTVTALPTLPLATVTATPLPPPSTATTTSLPPPSTATSLPPPSTATATPFNTATSTPVPTSTPTDTPTFTPTPTDTPIPTTVQISGRIFEDTNYSGGNGTAFGAGDAPLPNVQVELYDGSTLINTATTDASGVYTFLAVPGSATYTLRVVSATLGDSDTPPAAGFNFGFSSAVAEQTYENNGLSGNGGPGALGGNNPTVSDLSTAAGSGVGDTNVTVTTTNTDVVGVDVGFTYNLVVNTNNSNQGALRQALTNANAIAGITTIVFNIAGAGPHTIQPASSLPQITDSIIIDGATQPGYAGIPVIELDGRNTIADGLLITAGNSTVRGLAINRFFDDGIELRSGGNNVIQNNYLGTNVTGNLAAGNGFGIYITASNDNTITGNLLSGNSVDGILVSGSLRNDLQDNLVGTDAGGTAPIPNGNNGIGITSSNNTIVGGAGGGNTVAFNAANGIAIQIGSNNSILSNAIFNNGRLGIDLEYNNSVTPNDNGDGDSGANTLLNFPVVYTATLGGGTVTVIGEARPNTTVEFFMADPDPTGYGEGQTLVGSGLVNSGTPGTVDPTAWQFSFVLSAGTLVSGDELTATATDAAGNTSEFAQNVTVN